MMNRMDTDTIASRESCVVTATMPRDQRPENRRRLAHQVVEPEELARLARRHEPPEQRSRQRLNAPLHEADDDGERVELGFGVQEVRVARGARVHRDGNEDARRAARSSCRATRTPSAAGKPTNCVISSAVISAD